MQYSKIDIYPVSQFVVQEIGKNPNRKQLDENGNEIDGGFTIMTSTGRVYIKGGNSGVANTTSNAVPISSQHNINSSTQNNNSLQAPGHGEGGIGQQQSNKKDNTALGKLTRLKAKYDKEGTIRSVEGVVLFHEHNHPHILLLRYTTGTSLGQGGNSAATVSYRLPGGKCKPDEREADCLLRKLGRRLLGFPKPAVALAAQQLQQQQQNAEMLEASMSPKGASLRPSGIITNQQEDDDDFFTSTVSSLKGVSGIKTPLIGASVASLGAPPPLPSILGTTPTKSLAGGASPSMMQQYSSPLMSQQSATVPPSLGASPILTSGAGITSSALISACGNATQAAAEHFRVGEMVSRWYRPNFDRLLYPYSPPHVTSVKERKYVFVVHVEPATRFLLNHTVDQMLGGKSNTNQRGGTARNSGGGGAAFSAFSGAAAMAEDEPYELVAVPLFEVYQNAQKYGTVIESLPDVISRFHINYC